MANTEYDVRYIAFDDAVRAQVAEGRTIVGRPIVFNTRTSIGDLFIEEVAPEAVNRTLEGNLDVHALYNHDFGKVLGRRMSTTLRLRKAEDGVYVEIDLPATTLGNDVREEIRRGDTTGMSFRITKPVYQWRSEAGQRIGRLVDMEFTEVSIVARPAYPQASAALRSLEAWEAAQGRNPKDLKRIAKLKEQERFGREFFKK
jgi:HK97 family phage prohead protease